MAKKPAKPAKKSPASTGTRCREARAQAAGFPQASAAGEETRRARTRGQDEVRHPNRSRRRRPRRRQVRIQEDRRARPAVEASPRRNQSRRQGRRQERAQAGRNAAGSGAARQSRKRARTEQGNPGKPAPRTAPVAQLRWRRSSPARRPAATPAHHKPTAEAKSPPSSPARRAEDARHEEGSQRQAPGSSPRELTPADVEARKRRLKNLIVLGKERGFLTYAEINDHLPDDILDAEQIEGIISMINDMGIQVYDEAPDAETLLMSETAPTVAERRRRGSRRGRGIDARLRIRPHHRPGAHVHARDGLGRAPDPRRRDRDRQADRGRLEAHDHGDLRLPDDGRARSWSSPTASRRTRSRSTTSSTA